MYPIKVREKYNPKNLENLGDIYSVAYMGNYKEGRYIEYSGSHPGVDIVPQKPNDDVFCVLDGKVIKSGEDNYNGKYIFIKHFNLPDINDINKKINVVSCYLHLEKIFVEQNQLLNEGDIIGKTGNTGMSFGEHLHFQIDREEVPFNPFWPYSGADVKKAGITFSEGVNIGLGVQKAKDLTINPLLYLDFLENIISGVVLNKTEVSYVGEKLQNNIKISDFNNEKYNTFLQELIKNKVFNLDLDNNFNPEKLITRGEFLKVIFLYNNIELNDNKKTFYDDVDKNSWQLKYVNTAYELDLISKNNNLFNPNNNISRVESLKIYLNLLKISPSTPNNSIYEDLTTNSWQLKYAEFVRNKDIFEMDNNFDPNKPISRYELIKILFLIKK
ncbi:MAG: peptidoglycan DD-metalloendopeptidase family protein [Candidatus Gracilibacteria bacterium]|nr:peptidoglycan DD-metalloendopeptidase family protein [Candidatus Gracilibacteria bacterium]